MYLWGTSCGDTELAVLGAKYAVETVIDPTPDMIPHILRCLRVYVLALREHTMPSGEKKQKKHLAKLLQGDHEVDLKKIYEHIALLLDLLKKICKETKIINQEILNCACAFSACGDKDFL